jgi:hypothetical protein
VGSLWNILSLTLFTWGHPSGLTTAIISLGTGEPHSALSAQMCSHVLYISPVRQACYLYLQVTALGLRQCKQLAQGHTASMWP